MVNSLKKERQSGIELLRICAALGVVYGHFLNTGGLFTNASISGVNYGVMTLIRSIVIASVDIFVIISGYFLCTTQNRSIGKPLNLLLQISVFSVVLTVILSILGFQKFSVNGLLSAIIPSNWFVTLYIVLYLISPYMNVIYKNLSVNTWKYFIGILLLLFSIWPTVLGVADHFGVPFTKGLSTMGHGGNNAGYTIVNFITLYSIGAFVRYNDLDKKLNVKLAILLAFICVILLWGIRFIPMNTQPWHIAGWYDNILVILLATMLFVIFKRINIRSSFVNKLAKAAFTCYIIHKFFFKMISPEDVLVMPLIKALGFIFLFSIGVYMVSWCLFMIFDVSVGKFLKKLDEKPLNLV